MAKAIPGVRWDVKREKWFIDYYDGRGRRHREWGIRSRPFKSQREAADALASRKASILADRYDWKPREASPSFDELLDWYLQTHSVLKRSHRGDLTNAKPVRAFFGKFRVDEITAADVQAYKVKRSRDISRKTRRQISPAKVNLELNLLKAIFSRAMEATKDAKGTSQNAPPMRKVDTNPVKDVKLFRPDNRRSRTLCPAEVERLLANFKPYVQHPVRVLLSTGLRLSEVMNLRRQDILFRDGGTSIRVQRKGGNQQMIAVGSHLTRLLLDVVRSLPEQEGAQAPLWRKPNGKQLKNFRGAWVGACRRAGVENLWRHDLRRTFGSQALMNGADIVTLRDQLGHSNTQVTERYLWPEARRQKEAVESVSAWVDRALNGQQAPSAQGDEQAQVLEK